MIHLDPYDGRVPTNARNLALLATEHDWLVGITYADYLGHAGEDKHSIAVRMRRFGVSAWAVWVDGKFDAAALSSPLSAYNYRDFKTVIQRPHQGAS